MDHWRNETFHLVISRHIIDEVRRAWGKPYWRNRVPHDRLERAIHLLELEAEVVPITAHVEGVASHAADDLVIATAISGNAEFLVTGDMKLRAVETYRGVTILAPREFLDLLDQRGELSLDDIEE
jgi:putative PIN family toxin of toxin-antitoxin system